MKFDQILLDFTDSESGEEIYWRLKDAFQGVQIFGGIGSGKTSGSGRTLARAFLKKGFGGLVLCAKPDERKDWENLALKEDRFDDLIVFTEPKPDENGNITDKEFFFNPLDYEATRLGGGDTFNLVNLFMQIYQMGKVITGEGLESGGERFWDNALKRCLSRMIDLLRLAGESVTIDNMYRLVSESLSKTEIEHLNELRKNAKDKKSMDDLASWGNYNYYVHCYLEAIKKYTELDADDPKTKELHSERKKQIQVVKNYFEREFANLAEKTRTIVVESFLGLAEPFQTGILKKYFSANKITISPENIFEEGKIIILDFPIKNYLDAGVYAQGIFKLLFQQAVERRTYKENRNIPVFLWVDEAHNFLNSYDQIFQTTARSAGVSTVFISQNISNYYVAIGGKNPTARVNSLLGNLSTKIFHNNNDYVTNEWASNIIGRSWQDIPNFSVGQSQSFGMSKQFHWDFEPHRFTKLRTGGETGDRETEFKVQGVVVASRELANEKNFILRSFYQK